MTMLLAVRVALVSAPVFVMIALIPFITNDYVLTAIYIGVIAVATLRYTRNDRIFLVFGFFMLLLGEYAFISTGVETFERRTLFGVMPLWLPFLWAYIFVAIRQSALLFEKYL